MTIKDINYNLLFIQNENDIETLMADKYKNYEKLDMLSTREDILDMLSIFQSTNNMLYYFSAGDSLGVYADMLLKISEIESSNVIVVCVTDMSLLPAPLVNRGTIYYKQAKYDHKLIEAVINKDFKAINSVDLTEINIELFLHEIKAMLLEKSLDKGMTAETFNTIKHIDWYYQMYKNEIKSHRNSFMAKLIKEITQ